MGKPTLLIPGNLKGGAGRAHPEAVPAEYIADWVKRRMPEYGGAPPRGPEDRVLIVKSETGSGKSTVLPARLFRLLRHEKTARQVRLAGAGVICTQPRVLTAQTLARDMGADTANYPDLVLGDTVGFHTGPATDKPGRGLVYATAGVLLFQLRVLPDAEIMARYRFIIIDEAHERDLPLDSIMMQLKGFLRRNMGNPRLPFVFLASATMPVKKYARYFGVGAENIVRVAGRAFPIRTIYPARGTNNYPREAARLAVEIHTAHLDDDPGRADILIFMPGATEIKAVVEALLHENWAFLKPQATAPPYLVLAVTGEEVRVQARDYRLVKEDRRRLPQIPADDGVTYLKPFRRIVVATVVAETGLTIETLKYVIDPGWNRAREVYYPGGFQGLITRPAPRSRLKQRMGRAGRLFPGEYYPLYTENVFGALDAEQPPTIVTEGVGPIFLDVARVTAAASPAKIFRVADLDMLDPPPADALAHALAEAATFGYLRAAPDLGGHRLTRLGEVAARFNFLGMAQVQTLLAGYLWGAALQDLALIVALYGSRGAPALYAAPAERTAAPAPAPEPVGARALRAGLPPYITGRAGGGEVEIRPPTEAEAFYYRARLLISDDFIEALLAFEGFAAALETTGGDLPRLQAWCDGAGVDFDEAIVLAGMRDEVMREMLLAGLNPFWGCEQRLAVAPASGFFDAIVRLKRCIYAGLRGNVLTYDAKANVYRTRAGQQVSVPPAYLDVAQARFRGMGAEPPKPTRLVTDQITLKGVKKDKTEAHDPIMYRLRTGLVSVLDGYVEDDAELWAPRG